MHQRVKSNSSKENLKELGQGRSRNEQREREMKYNNNMYPKLD